MSEPAFTVGFVGIFLHLRKPNRSTKNRSFVRTNWRKIGYVGINFGIIILAVSIIADYFGIENYLANPSGQSQFLFYVYPMIYPMTEFAFLFLLMSISAFIVGFAGIYLDLLKSNYYSAPNYSRKKFKIPFVIGLVGLVLALFSLWFSPLVSANFEIYWLLADYFEVFGIVGFILLGVSIFALYRQENGIKSSMWTFLEKMAILIGFFSLFAAWWLTNISGTQGSLDLGNAFLLLIFALVDLAGCSISFTERNRGMTAQIASEGIVSPRYAHYSGSQVHGFREAEHPSRNQTAPIMLFVLGLFLVGIGVMLMTITQTITTYGNYYGLTIPNGTESINPYAGQGFLMIMVGILVLVGAFITFRKHNGSVSPNEEIQIPPPPPPV
jgi:hypothetical protein